MALTRWDPFRELFDVQRQMNRFFDEDSPVYRLSSRESATWVPPVDIHETDDSFVLAVELPGVKKEDVKLEVKDSVLWLSGERRQEKEINEKNVHRIERRYGLFNRAFNVPSNVDAAQVKATYKDGVLEIALPKVAAAKPRQIEIAA